MNRQFFDEYYYLERNHWWFRARMNIIITHLNELTSRLNQPIKILNVGAGTGYTTEVLNRYGITTSVEYDADCCVMAKEKTGLEFENESITALPYADNSFDLVTAFDVIEHVEDHQKAVSELIRVTKKGGMIYTTVPTFMFLWSHHDVVNQHIRRYTKGNFMALWQPHLNEVQLVYNTYFNFWLFPPIAAFRALSKLLPQKAIRKGAGSDFTLYKSNAIDTVLYNILNTENFFVRNKISLPFGVSLLTSFRKK